MRQEKVKKEKKKVGCAIWYGNETKAPSCKIRTKTETKQKANWETLTRMRFEDRDGWGHLGNKRVDPDDRAVEVLPQQWRERERARADRR